MSNPYEDVDRVLRAGLGAQMQNANPYNQIAAPAETPFLELVGGRIDSLRGLLSEMNGDVATLRERLFGPAPGISANGASPPKPDGQTGGVLMMLDALIELAHCAADHARALNRRI